MTQNFDAKSHPTKANPSHQIPVDDASKNERLQESFHLPSATATSGEKEPLIEDFQVFIRASPTPWHAVAETARRLLNQGFIHLSESKKWAIEPGKRYFVTRNGSSLSAFITPHTLPKKAHILAAHTDSPCFKLKPHPELRKAGSLLLAVEPYGAPLLTSWLNRDLAIGGRIVYENIKGEIKERLVALENDLVVIPQLAIHLDREVNEKGLLLNKQDHFFALAALDASLEEKSSYLELILKKENSEFKQLIAHDLLLYPVEPPRLVGYQKSLLSSYRLDNLSSVHAALSAFIKESAPLQEELKMIVFWDNEEIGSQTAQGANSPFFLQTLERLFNYYSASKEDFFCLLHNSLCISIDLAHALHPNFAEKSDPQHPVLMGKGVALKNHAGQRYATDARSTLPVWRSASMQKIALQRYACRNDIPCGSTVGPLHATLTGIPTVDIGCPELSMHSCRELMACRDHIELSRLLEDLCKC